MIEGVMSIMEGDEGIDRQKYKELLLFSKGRDRKIGTEKNWDTEKLGDRKREGQRIHRNSYKFREKKILRKNVEKYYSFSVEKKSKGRIETTRKRKQEAKLGIFNGFVFFL